MSTHSFLEFYTDKPSTHRKHYLKPSSVINVEKIQSLLRDLIGFKSGRIKYPRQFLKSLSFYLIFYNLIPPQYFIKAKEMGGERHWLQIPFPLALFPFGVKGGSPPENEEGEESPKSLMIRTATRRRVRGRQRWLKLAATSASFMV